MDIYGKVDLVAKLASYLRRPKTKGIAAVSMLTRMLSDILLSTAKAGRCCSQCEGVLL